MKIEGCHVLVVEDEYMLAEELSARLRCMGAIVVGPEPNVQAALARIKADGIDLAVLDVNLGDQKVFPVADLLTELGKPFVFVTGYERDILPARYANVSTCDKPVDVRELGRAVARIES